MENVVNHQILLEDKSLSKRTVVHEEDFVKYAKQELLSRKGLLSYSQEMCLIPSIDVGNSLISDVPHITNVEGFESHLHKYTLINRRGLLRTVMQV